MARDKSTSNRRQAMEEIGRVRDLKNGDRRQILEVEVMNPKRNGKGQGISDRRQEMRVCGKIMEDKGQKSYDRGRRIQVIGYRKDDRR